MTSPTGVFSSRWAERQNRKEKLSAEKKDGDLETFQIKREGLRVSRYCIDYYYNCNIVYFFPSLSTAVSCSYRLPFCWLWMSQSDRPFSSLFEHTVPNSPIVVESTQRGGRKEEEKKKTERTFVSPLTVRQAVKTGLKTSRHA